MSNSRKFVLQLARNLCAPHKAFHKLQLKVLVGLDFCKAHAGVRRRRCNFSETPPPIHLATADKPVSINKCAKCKQLLRRIETPAAAWEKFGGGMHHRYTVAPFLHDMCPVAAPRRSHPSTQVVALSGHKLMYIFPSGFKSSSSAMLLAVVGPQKPLIFLSTVCRL